MNTKKYLKSIKNIKDSFKDMTNILKTRDKTNWKTYLKANRGNKKV